MKKLIQKVEQYNMQYAVELLGNLSYEKTLAYIKSADVFVLNSGYEGLSHVLLEAISCGVPVLASRSGGNPEILRSENLFDYNDKEQIKELILKMLALTINENKNLAKQEGLILGTEYSSGIMLEETKKILQSVCGS